MKREREKEGRKKARKKRNKERKKEESKKERKKERNKKERKKEKRERERESAQSLLIRHLSTFCVSITRHSMLFYNKPCWTIAGYKSPDYNRKRVDTL